MPNKKQAINRIGTSGVITIATGNAGRGISTTIQEVAKQSGGLQIIFNGTTEEYLLIQAKGRSFRLDPKTGYRGWGSFTHIISLRDLQKALPNDPSVLNLASLGSGEISNQKKFGWLHSSDYRTFEHQVRRVQGIIEARSRNQRLDLHAREVAGLPNVTLTAAATQARQLYEQTITNPENKDSIVKIQEAWQIFLQELQYLQTNLYVLSIENGGDSNETYIRHSFDYYQEFKNEIDKITNPQSDQNSTPNTTSQRTGPSIFTRAFEFGRNMATSFLDQYTRQGAEVGQLGTPLSLFTPASSDPLIISALANLYPEVSAAQAKGVSS